MEDLKFNVLETNGCETTIDVNISGADVTCEIDNVLADIQSNAAIDGFRKGKAPMEFIKREYSGTALERALNNLILKSAEEIVKKNNYEPVAAPAVELGDYEAGKQFSFKLRIEQSPKFEVANYKKIKATKKLKKIGDDDINAVLKRLQDRHSTLVDAGDVCVEQTHYVIADYSGTVDGKSLGKPVREQFIDLSHEELPQGFAKGLLGAKAGEQKIIETEISGKPAKFEVTVKSIKKKISPTLDDEFAKDNGFATLDLLKEEIKKNLLLEEEKRARRELEKAISDELIANNSFPIPKSLVNKEVQKMIEKAQEYFMKRQGYSKEEFEKSLPALKEKYAKDAENEIRLSYILSKIAEQEKIIVSDSEVETKIAELSAGAASSAEAYRQHKDYVSLVIKERKIYDFLIENAKIKEE